MLIVGATALLPNFVAMPFISRYEVWGAELTFITIVIAAHILENSWRALTIVCLCCLATFAAIECRTRIGSENHTSASAHVRPKPQLVRKPAVQIVRMNADPTVMVREFGHRYVLHKIDGTIDRFDDQGHLQTTFDHVPGPARDLIACGRALTVTHGTGKVTSVSPVNGRVLVDYPYADELGDLACGGGSCGPVSRPRIGRPHATRHAQRRGRVPSGG